MEMNECPKYNHCSAPICPLDPGWQERTHPKGEHVCFYLIEYVKPGAAARFQGSTTRELYSAIQSLAEPISSRYAPIRRALERAKRSGSRMRRPGVMCDAA